MGLTPSSSVRQFHERGRKRHLNPDFRACQKVFFTKKEMTPPLSPVYSLLNKDDEWNDDKLREAIHFLYRALTFKDPKESELSEYLDILKKRDSESWKKGWLNTGAHANIFR